LMESDSLEILIASETCGNILTGARTERTESDARFGRFTFFDGLADFSEFRDEVERLESEVIVRPTVTAHHSAIRFRLFPPIRARTRFRRRHRSAGLGTHLVQGRFFGESDPDTSQEVKRGD